MGHWCCTTSAKASRRDACAIALQKERKEKRNETKQNETNERKQIKGEDTYTGALRAPRAGSPILSFRFVCFVSFSCRFFFTSYLFRRAIDSKPSWLEALNISTPQPATTWIERLA